MLAEPFWPRIWAVELDTAENRKRLVKRWSKHLAKISTFFKLDKGGAEKWQKSAQKI
jgi:hypothetical protein